MMVTKHASPKLAGKKAREVVALLESVSLTELREWVERLAVPRHYLLEPEENEEVGLWIAAELQSWGYQVQFQGPWRNVVALPKSLSKPMALVGAHYDSVGGCPGADDNASAVAALLGCARAVATRTDRPPVCFVSFNREEDDLAGSRDFVAWLASGPGFKVTHAHVLEMVGFASDVPKSQRIPPGLPVKVPDTGNFLGVLANSGANQVLDGVLASASTYLPGLPVIGLNVKLGLEKLFPVLLRSDHAPFWARGIPATMWTDTSEFRNPFYHQPGDKPCTLNYGFLRAVTQLLVACVLEETQR
jgi:Zn-dependent M28 family amino/carboxypeptidase